VRRAGFRAFPKNQYFVGVQWFEEEIDSVQTLLNVPVTSSRQAEPIPLWNIATLRRGTVPTEILPGSPQHDDLERPGEVG
jgi:hypothetical protein